MYLNNVQGFQLDLKLALWVPPCEGDCLLNLPTLLHPGRPLAMCHCQRLANFDGLCIAQCPPFALKKNVTTEEKV